MELNDGARLAMAWELIPWIMGGGFVVIAVAVAALLGSARRWR